MRLMSLRVSMVAVGVGGLLAFAVPTAGAAPASKGPAIGNSCLIGTWHDNHGITTTRWQGHTVKMRYGGGDVDHISGSGKDRDNWAKSKPLIGKYAGHKLTERVRGTNSLLLSAKGNTLTQTLQGWTPKSSNRYLYRGKHSKGYLNQSGTYTFHFRCTDTTLTFLKHGKVQGTETRLSSKP